MYSLEKRGKKLATPKAYQRRKQLKVFEVGNFEIAMKEEPM
jgi:hypothetical protein